MEITIWKMCEPLLRKKAKYIIYRLCWKLLSQVMHSFNPTIEKYIDDRAQQNGLWDTGLKYIFQTVFAWSSKPIWIND